MLKNLKVGDPCIIVQDGCNGIRRKAEDGLPHRFPATVAKIGRKYITVQRDGWREEGEQFSIETGIEHPNYHHYTLHPSWGDYSTEHKRKEDCDKLRSKFSRYGELGLTSDQVERIINILEENKEESN